jgi:phage portal protein BeeE
MGIDPALLGDNANKTYSNFQEAVRALIQLKVLPLLNWILDEMNNWYMPRYGTPEAVLFIDESTIKQLREDLNEKMKRLVDGVAGTIITPDEARTELGNDEIGGTAASLLAKVGTVRLEDIGLSFGLEEGDEEGAEKFLMAIHEQLKKNSNGKVKT